MENKVQHQPIGTNDPAPELNKGGDTKQTQDQGIDLLYDRAEAHLGFLRDEMKQADDWAKNARKWETWITQGRGATSTLGVILVKVAERAVEDDDEAIAIRHVAQEALSRVHADMKRVLGRAQYANERDNQFDLVGDYRFASHTLRDAAKEILTILDLADDQSRPMREEIEEALRKCRDEYDLSDTGL